MNAGRIEQVGSPAQVFEEPASPFVMRFLGAVNVFQGRVEGDRAYVNGTSSSPRRRRPRRAPRARLRPAARARGPPRGRSPGSFAARVERLVPLGAAVRVELSAPATAARSRWSSTCAGARRSALAPGDAVHLSPRRVRVFPTDEASSDSLTASGL